MKILIVASNNKGKYAPFIVDQVEALRKQGVICEYFGIVGNGKRGYLKNIKSLNKRITEFSPDVIHAHYGLSGLLANLQRKVPVVTTYHGSDINDPKVLKFSKLSIFLSKYNIFVSQKNVDIASVKNRYTLLPCGVDLDVFQTLDKQSERTKRGWNCDDKKVLFAGAFSNEVKDSPLAIAAIDVLLHEGYKVELIELKGFSRRQTAELMCAVDALLLTSKTEGSPQVVKEAMSCGCPIVSVDVGDVADVISGVEGCYIADRNPQDIACKLKDSFAYGGKTTGRSKIINLGLDNNTIAQKLISIYNGIE